MRKVIGEATDSSLRGKKTVGSRGGGGGRFKKQLIDKGQKTPARGLPGRVLGSAVDGQGTKDVSR